MNVHTGNWHRAALKGIDMHHLLNWMKKAMILQHFPVLDIKRLILSSVKEFTTRYSKL
jgi:hypothetical protein